MPDAVEYEKDDEEAPIPDIIRDFDDSDDDSVTVTTHELSSDFRNRWLMLPVTKYCFVVVAVVSHIKIPIWFKYSYEKVKHFRSPRGINVPVNT